MDNFKSFESLLYSVNDRNLDDIALRLFRYQAKNNLIYKEYLQHLNQDIEGIANIRDIPFMPISFFKAHCVKSGDWRDGVSFTSSGTTGASVSTHHVASLDFYLNHAERCFSHFFGPLDSYHILALMPSYLDNHNSSLVAMVNSFIQKTNSEFSGFYNTNFEKLHRDIQRLHEEKNRKIILWGVSFALLDFGEKFDNNLGNCIIIETGGMKGRRMELTRTELHLKLKEYFKINTIYSEYGMTELLSQSYTKGDELFYPSPWMKLLIREAVDPFEKGLIDSPGGINVIDLANIHSIAFIETEDAGRVYNNGSFEVLGRLDNSDIRGCNLMAE